MRPVGGTKRIEDEAIGERDERRSEIRVVGGFPSFESCVLEHDHRALRGALDGRSRPRTGNVVGHVHLEAAQFSEPRRHRVHA